MEMRLPFVPGEHNQLTAFVALRLTTLKVRLRLMVCVICIGQFLSGSVDRSSDLEFRV